MKVWASLPRTRTSRSHVSSPKLRYIVGMIDKSSCVDDTFTSGPLCLILDTENGVATCGGRTGRPLLVSTCGSSALAPTDPRDREQSLHQKESIRGKAVAASSRSCEYLRKNEGKKKRKDTWDVEENV